MMDFSSFDELAMGIFENRNRKVPFVQYVGKDFMLISQWHDHKNCLTGFVFRKQDEIMFYPKEQDVIVIKDGIKAPRSQAVEQACKKFAEEVLSFVDTQATAG